MVLLGLRVSVTTRLAVWGFKAHWEMVLNRGRSPEIAQANPASHSTS